MNEEAARESGRGLLVVGLVAIALLGLGALVPRAPDFDAFFGLEAYRSVGLVGWIPASVALLVLLTVPGAATATARFLGGLAARIPFRVPLLTALAVVAGFLLTNQRLSGDAGAIVTRVATGHVYPSNALTSYVHQLLASVPGVDPREAVRITSVLAGGIYALVSVGLAREVFPDGPRRAALATVLLTAGTAALFFGTLEVYALPFAAIGAYLLVGIRFLRGKAPDYLPPLALGVAFTLHGSVGLLLPSLLLLANGGRLRPFRIRRWLGWGACFLVPVALVAAALYFFTWRGAPPEDGPMLHGSFVGGLGQGPFLPLIRTLENLLYRYAILDAEHLVGVLDLWLMAALPGTLLLVAGWRLLRRPGPEVAFVATAAAFLAIFPIFWNVNYELRRDWDLFSSVGVPLSLLGGWAYLSTVEGRAPSIRVAALGLFAFLPFVLTNATGSLERLEYAATLKVALDAGAQAAPTETRREGCRRASERWSERANALDPIGTKMETARDLWMEGRADDAIAMYRRAVEIDPRRHNATLYLGLALWSVGKREEARVRLRESIRSRPDRIKARLNLGRTYDWEGRPKEAVPILEKAVRYGGIDPEVTDALRLLAEIAAREGDPERADLMNRLADERLALRSALAREP